MNFSPIALSAIAITGFLSVMEVAGAASVSCSADNSTVTVGPALGCAAVPNANDSEGIARSLTFVGPGGSYGPFADLLFLDKDNRGTGEFANVILNDEYNARPGISENAFYGSTDSTGNLTGTFTIDLALLAGWKNLVVFIKPGNDGVYFLVDMSAAAANAINGLYTIIFSGWAGNPGGGANGISHMSLYGSLCASPTEPGCSPPQEVPAPDPGVLLACGLIGLALTRRMRPVRTRSTP